MTAILDTDRLLLREFVPEDLETFYRLVSDPEVTRFTGDGGKAREEVKRGLEERVFGDYRKHGYGHALLEAAVTWAEEKGVDQVTAITDGNRDNNRFLARLGLATLGTVRISSTAGLRKKLAGDRGRPAASGSNRHLVEVLAHRRSMRRLQNGG